jgi:hypothetical protein
MAAGSRGDGTIRRPPGSANSVRSRSANVTAPSESASKMLVVARLGGLGARACGRQAPQRSVVAVGVEREHLVGAQRDEQLAEQDRQRRLANAALR